MKTIILTAGNERLSPINGMLQVYCEDRNIKDYDILKNRKKFYFYAGGDVFLIGDYSSEKIEIKKTGAKVEKMDVLDSETLKNVGWVKNI